ncbi:lymphocyte antigen 6 complex locus protein G6d [Anguilla rostrata]|uniref:lymphocyte antigen 6 complex locus protein G6d n=1 Tax=Anguilla rostrata TaxID=7938 RepID=UPI0030D14B73
MNRILLGIFAVVLLFTIGHALQCYNCDLGLASLCITTKITCKTGEQCFSGKGKAVGFVPITQKGCLADAECNKVSNVTFGDNHAVYTTNRTCCNQDLCNSSPRLAAPALLPLTVATISASLLMSRTLV